MTGFLLDLRHAVRLWLKHRTFVTATVTTIAVAIAANTAIFSIVYGALLKPLNLPHPERVVRIEERHQGRRLNLTGATFVDLHDRTRLLEAVAAYRIRSVGLYGREGAPMQLTAAEVSADYFQVLGRPPARGRWFTPEDLRTGAPRSVVVSESVAKRIFGGADDVVGRTIVIDAVPVQIAGIAPAGLFVPGSPDVWLPQDSSSPLLRNRRAHLFTTIARLRETATFASMSQEVTSLASSIEHDAGRVDPDMALTAESLQARMVESIRPALLMLWAAVGLVLLIAAANLANLLLMQGVSRSRELSIRVALGAARSRVARQISTECLLLAGFGGALGTALSLWSLPVLRAALPASIPRADNVSSSTPVVLFGISVSVLMAVLFGLAPAMRRPMHVPIDALRARATRGRSQSFARSVLVSVEVAFTVILLAGAVLLGRSLWAILQIDPGYNSSGVIAVRLSLPSATYPDAAAHNAFYSRVLERIVELSNVSAAGVTGALPLTGTPATTMEPEPIRVGEQLSADVITASPGFFESLNIPLRQGRVFTERDVKGTQPVVIINEAAARRFWPSMNPLGHSVTMKDWGLPYRAEVVGIVGNIRQAGAEAESSPAVYYPLAQFPETTLSEAIVVRARGDVSPVIAEVQNQVWAIDPRQPIGWIRTMDEISAASTSERRFNMLLIASFAAAGLLLSALGIYGIVAFAVAERAHEFAVRIALGAPPSDLLRVVMAHGAGPVAIGLCVGLVCAVIASRLLETLLFGVRPTDPVTLVGVTVTIGCVTVLACAAPLRRAVRLDPIAALRIE
jgi:putative ABC transport system permease protein